MIKSYFLVFFLATSCVPAFSSQYVRRHSPWSDIIAFSPPGEITQAKSDGDVQTSITSKTSIKINQQTTDNISCDITGLRKPYCIGTGTVTVNYTPTNGTPCSITFISGSLLYRSSVISSSCHFNFTQIKNVDFGDWSLSKLSNHETSDILLFKITDPVIYPATDISTI